MIRIERELGRIKLNMVTLRLGSTICIILTDGESAVGTVNHGSCLSETDIISMGSQEECLLVAKLSGIYGRKRREAFVICCGIKFDKMTRKETQNISVLSRQMVEELCLRLG